MPKKKRPQIVRHNTAFDGCVRDYAHNLLIETNITEYSWFPRRDESVRLILDMCGVKSTGLSRNGEWDNHKDKCNAHLSAFRDKPRIPAALASVAAENLALLAELFGLDREEHDILQFLLTVEANRQLKDLTREFDDISVTMAAEIVAVATRVPLQKVRRALSRSGRLMESGLVTPHVSMCDFPEMLELKSGLSDVVLTPGLDEQQLFGMYLTHMTRGALSWDDYAHLLPEVETVRALLSAAVRNRHAGMNVLFVGPSGTGKTELAQLLAAEIDTELYAVGTAEEDGGSASAKERLSSLLLAQRLLAKHSSLVLFDELEDLFSLAPMSTRREAQMSKQWFNLILERNPVPTIWISNDVGGVDKAFLRRFMYVIEFQPLSARQRARVLTRQLGPDAEVSAADVDAIAARYAASPALFASAVTAAAMIAPSGKPDRANIERILAPVVKLVEGDSQRVHEPVSDSHYRLDLLNASEDLTRIAEALSSWRRSDELGVSMCLYGPPGTGKTAFAHHIAQRLGIPVVHKRASDLLGPYVGMTEQAIAAAFREADRDGAVLLFDEADSFLRNRRHARQSWEVTQVNEVLTQLESYRGFVVCTTNLIDDLDEAAARRFTIKVELRYLRPEQSIHLFEEMFGKGLARDFSGDSGPLIRAALGKITNLTPGDLAAIARRARSLGGTSTVGELIDAVMAAARAKPGQRRALGFVS